MKNLISMVVIICFTATFIGCGSKDEASDLGADVAPELGSGSSDPSAFDIGEPDDSTDSDADETADSDESGQSDTSAESEESAEDSSPETTPEETHVLEDDPDGN